MNKNRVQLFLESYLLEKKQQEMAIQYYLRPVDENHPAAYPYCA